MFKFEGIIDFIEVCSFEVSDFLSFPIGILKNPQNLTSK